MKTTKRSVIVCIDDENIILRSLQAELRNAVGAEYIIEIAETGEEALEIVQEYIEDAYQVPVVICDYIMPSMKGDKVLVQIHQMSPKTRNIMLTGQSSLEGITYAINHANLYRFITKPWSPNDLAMTIQQALKSFEQDVELETKNKELAELNANLEQKVRQRTLALDQSNLELQQTLATLQAQHQMIATKNNQILASLNYAKRIQTAILPTDEFLKATLNEHLLIYKPRDIVSGDFYWCERIAADFIYGEDVLTDRRIFKGIRNEKIIVVVADCTGHGVSGAFMSMIGNDLLNNIIIQNDVISPDEILYQMHKGIRTSLRQQSSKIMDGMDMAICVIDKEERTLEFAGAKLPLILIQNQTLAQINGDKKGIGGHIINGERVYQKHSFKIQVPTYCYIFSDGFQDQFGGENDRKFMLNNLRKLLFEIHRLPFTIQQNLLEERLQNWQNDKKQTDDILLMGFRCDTMI